MSDYIPDNDAEFDTWQKDLLAYANDAGNLARWGLTAAFMQAANAQQTVWNGKYGAMLATQIAAQAAMTGKKDSRIAYEPPLRSAVGQLQKNPEVTDQDRRAMKITIAETARTAADVPESSPDGEIDVATRLRHIINFWDSATPGVKAKPHGVRGAQIFIKIGGEAPTSPDECKYLATDTKTPYTHDFEMDEGGMMVYYLLRWENSRGEVGPWSRVISARVPQSS